MPTALRGHARHLPFECYFIPRRPKNSRGNEFSSTGSFLLLGRPAMPTQGRGHGTKCPICGSHQIRWQGNYARLTL